MSFIVATEEDDNEVVSPPDDHCGNELNCAVPAGTGCTSEPPQSSITGEISGRGKDSKIASPKDIPKWPNDLSSKYSPIFRLGFGAFGAVWKAYRREGPDEKSDIPDFVAIKTISISTDDARSYARREITILNELSPHRNIVAYVETFRYSAVYCVVLSLIEGPTLFSLLKKGGALSFRLGNIASCHLIHAVSHLHKHAILHRDIKPDNCIITGITLNDSRCWNDDFKEESQNVWNPKLVLIDFGFARALSPTEISDDIGLIKLITECTLNDSDAVKSESFQNKDSSPQHVNMINSALSEKVSTEHGQSNYFTKTKKKKGSTDLSRSMSRNKVLDLSAIGSKKYAAPEILNGIRNKPSNAKSLAPCVSNYGMVVDAYSVGAVIREIYTGVPPTENIDTYISEYNSLMKKFIRSLHKTWLKTAKRETLKKKKFRIKKDIPELLAELINGLISWNQLERMTTRTAKKHPWVQSCVDQDVAAAYYKEKNSAFSQDIHYLPCALASD